MCSLLHVMTIEPRSKLRTSPLLRFGMLGSVDANTGSPDLGWDTDQFPMDIRNTTLVMKVSSFMKVTVLDCPSGEYHYSLAFAVRTSVVAQFYLAFSKWYLCFIGIQLKEYHLNCIPRGGEKHF